MLQALYRMGYKGIMTGHGFRGIASTVMHENGFAKAHIEAQLSHKDKDKVGRRLQPCPIHQAAHRSDAVVGRLRGKLHPAQCIDPAPQGLSPLKLLHIGRYKAPLDDKLYNYLYNI